MPYGLIPTQIISSFAGAVESDFAVAPISGSEIILQEIEFQYEKLKMSFSDNVSKMLDRVDYEMPSISGGLYFTPGLTVVDGSMEVWIVDRCANICGKQSFRDCGCNYNLPSVNGLGCGITKTTEYTSIGNNTFQLNTAIDIDDKYIVVSYEVDAEATPITSLASILRDMVCANLGNRLFAAVDGGKWTIVEHYETQAEKWLKLLEGGWMPPELKRMRVMFRGGITSIKMGRG